VGGALDNPLSCLPQETAGLHRHSRRPKWLLRRAASLGSASSVFRVSAIRAAYSQDKPPLSAVGPPRAERRDPLMHERLATMHAQMTRLPMVNDA
jgi:hypothetical protein